MENKIRTEEEILKDFEKLGWLFLRNNERELAFRKFDSVISISKVSQWYSCSIPSSGRLAIPINMQEHKLLTELFTIWGWLNGRH